MTIISAAKLEKLVDKTILDALAPFGFVKDDTGGSFRDMGDVYQYVAGLTLRHGGKNKITPFGQTGFDSVNRIIFAFMAPGKPVSKATGTFQVDFRHFAGERDAYIGCETEDEVLQTLARVRDLVLDRMLPCLEKYSDPRQVLQAYILHDERQKNSLGIIGAHHYGSALNGLVLTRLFGPEHYESLKQRYQFFLDPLRPEIKDKVLKLLAYLDLDPLPRLPTS